MSERFILSVDIGTTVCKAAIFDLYGHEIAYTHSEYDILSPVQGWAEQDPLLWWKTVQKVVRECLDKSRISSNKIIGIGVTGQDPAVVPIDERGNPLRHSIIWMDQRASTQSIFIERETGKKFSPSSFVSKLLWIKEVEPQVYRAAFKFLKSASDFITYLLSQNPTRAIHKPEKAVYEVLELIGFDISKLPEPILANRVAGNLTSYAAKALGLPEDIPVINGGVDGVCATYGVGVSNPGEASAILGTSTCLNVCSEKEIIDPKNRIWTGFNLILEKWFASGCTNTSGASYRWFKDNFCQIEAKQAKSVGLNPYKYLDKQAETVKPGCDGLIFLPYLRGERSPIWDPNARGVFFGITLSHKKPHFIRAILEGCAFSLYDIARAIEETSLNIKEVRVCGGGAKSTLWRQIHADILGKRVLLPEVTNATLLGASILVACATGIFKNIYEAIRGMVRISECNEPNLELHKHYMEIYKTYKELYLSLRGLFKSNSRISG